MLHTLPRQGEPDHSLLEQLNPKCNRFDAIRVEAFSWALTMSQADLDNVLNGNDPEGLLRDSAKDMAANSDPLSRWVDQCLIPSEQNLQVTKLDWDLMFECYLGWSRYNNSRHTLQRHRFPNALRTVLGPKRCLPRTKESSNDAKANNRPRQTLAQFYAGFMLIPGILSQGKDALSHPTSEDFQPTRVSSGGLEKIAMLDQAIREPPVSG